MLENSSSQPLCNDSRIDHRLGVSIAPKARVEEAYILDVEMVGDLIQNSVESVDLVVRQLYDQMLLRRVGGKMKQRKYQKSWMFKYRLKKAFRIQLYSAQHRIKGSMKVLCTAMLRHNKSAVLNQKDKLLSLMMKSKEIRRLHEIRKLKQKREELQDVVSSFVELASQFKKSLSNKKKDGQHTDRGSGGGNVWVMFDASGGVLECTTVSNKVSLSLKGLFLKDSTFEFCSTVNDASNGFERVLWRHLEQCCWPRLQIKDSYTIEMERYMESDCVKGTSKATESVEDTGVFPDRDLKVRLYFFVKTNLIVLAAWIDLHDEFGDEKNDGRLSSRFCAFISREAADFENVHGWRMSVIQRFVGDVTNLPFDPGGVVCLPNSGELVASQDQWKWTVQQSQIAHALLRVVGTWVLVVGNVSIDEAGDEPLVQKKRVYVLRRGIYDFITSCETSRTEDVIVAFEFELHHMISLHMTLWQHGFGDGEVAQILVTDSVNADLMVRALEELDTMVAL